MSDLSSHGALASSSVHNVGKQQLDSASDSDDGGERPHKKQSNIKTMARINLYSKIKVKFVDEFMLLLGNSNLLAAHSRKVQ